MTLMMSLPRGSKRLDSARILVPLSESDFEDFRVSTRRTVASSEIPSTSSSSGRRPSPLS